MLLEQLRVAASANPLPVLDLLELRRRNGCGAGVTPACLGLGRSGIEVELAGERRVLPGRLPIARHLQHLPPRAPEHVLEYQPRHWNGGGERGAVGAVRPVAVEGDLARRRGEGDETARGRTDRGETAGDRAAPASERVVAACVEDDDVDAACCALHGLENIAEAHAFDRHLRLVLDLGCDRNEVVVARDLHAVARIVEESDAV